MRRSPTGRPSKLPSNTTPPTTTRTLDLSNGQVVTINDSRPEDEEKRQLISKSSGRFVHLDPASSREQYRWMERFVASVEEASLRERLVLAIDGKGAFRRFKDVLLSYPVERDGGSATAPTCFTSTSTAGWPGKTSCSARTRRGVNPRSRPSPTCRWRSRRASGARAPRRPCDAPPAT
jgi:hypothetical protein